ncbi:transposase [Oesophagostomum dentatum]|uniref:Transposase n=1 Tax=Oesophagostomum dentatum TaxID=61180 RepID=A0A0B1S4D1_OESDE|nr:transposase [Oesophagostomum dentatum]
MDLELLKQTVNQDPFQITRDLTVTLGTTHTSVETGLKSLGFVKKLIWVGIGEQAQDIPKQHLRPKKVMVSVWWNIRGVVYWQLLDDGATIMANLYVQQLRALKANVESGGFARKI